MCDSQGRCDCDGSAAATRRNCCDCGSDHGGRCDCDDFDGKIQRKTTTNERNDDPWLASETVSPPT